MTDYLYDLDICFDPDNPNNIVRGGLIEIYDANDLEGTTLLALKDTSGNPIANPMTSNEYGVIGRRITTSPQCIWKSGPFSGVFNSYKGLRDEAVAAVAAAEEAKFLAEEAASVAAATAAAELSSMIAAGEFQGEPGQPGADGANVLPTDTAISQAIQAEGSATDQALTEKMANQVAPLVASALVPALAADKTKVSARFIPDIANSWWQSIQSYLINGRVFVGGCGADGGVRVGWADLENGVVGRTRLNPERYFQDDHDSVGLAFDTSGVNRRALAVYSPHDDDNYLRLREAEGYASFDSAGPEVLLQFGGGTPVAYGSILAKPAETNKRVNTTNGSAVLDSVTAASAPLAHGLVDGMRYRFTSAGAPAPFTAGTSYYVVNSSADATKFGLAATPGGAAIAATVTSADASKILTDSGRGLVRCRNGGFNKVARSANLQVSVTERPTATPPTFEDSADERFTLIEAAYIAHTEAGNTWWAIATGDPTPVPANASTKTYFFKGIKGGAGTIRNAAGNILGNLWGAAPAAGAPLIATSGAGATADLVYDAAGDDGRRYYDIARGGDAIAVMSFSRADFATVPGPDGVAVIADPARAELGGTYKVMRRKTSATTNAWIDETVVPTGKPFGAYKSVYVGGVCFERDDTLGNALLAVVEQGNIWTLRRYVRTGPNYPTTVPGTWAEDAVLYTAPAGFKLGRPKIPLGSEGRGAGNRVFTVSLYSYYDTASFNAIRGGEIVGVY